MRLSILSDRPNFKAGGNNPFISHKTWPTWQAGGAPFTAGNLRAAYRHGGAIPWGMIREKSDGSNVDVPIFPIPAPSVDSYYVMEKVQAAGGQTPDFTLIPTIVGTNPNNRPIITIAPPPLGTDLLLNTPSPFTDNIVAKLIHPDKPVLADSQINNYLREWIASSGGGGFGAAGLPLIRAPSTNLNTRRLGSQVTYFIRVLADQMSRSASPFGGPYPEIWPMSWNGTNWTADPTYRSGIWTVTGPGKPMTADCGNGWLYAVSIDPETGKITEAHKMPEACQVTDSVKSSFYYWQVGTLMTAPRCVAMTWPTGVRAISGYVARPSFGYPVGANFRPAKLQWRHARPWTYGLMVSDGGFSGPYWWTNQSGFPYTYPVIGDTGQSSAMGPMFPYRTMRMLDEGAPGWNDLATFPGLTAGGTGTTAFPGTMGGTLPAPGDEVIISGQSGWHNGVSSPPQEYALGFTLIPDASVSPIAIPLAHGGVIQGGSP
jgi:hypothetical protein